MQVGRLSIMHITHTRVLCRSLRSALQGFAEKHNRSALQEFAEKHNDLTRAHTHTHTHTQECVRGVCGEAPSSELGLASNHERVQSRHQYPGAHSHAPALFPSRALSLPFPPLPLSLWCTSARSALEAYMCRTCVRMQHAGCPTPCVRARARFLFFGGGRWPQVLGCFRIAR